jgi:hypothetical protein
MAKLRADYEYTGSNLTGLAREQLVKDLIHGAEVQTGSHRRRTHSLNELLKAVDHLAEVEAAELGNVIVRQNVFLAGRR